MKMMKETALAFLGAAVLCLTGCASMNGSGGQNHPAAEAESHAHSEAQAGGDATVKDWMAAGILEEVNRDLDRAVSCMQDNDPQYASALYALVQSCEKGKQGLPDQTVAAVPGKDGSLSIVPVEKAAGKAVIVWDPAVNALWRGTLSKSGAMDGPGIYLDYTFPEDGNTCRVHCNTGTFRDGRLNGEGTAWNLTYAIDQQTLADIRYTGTFRDNILEGAATMEVYPFDGDALSGTFTTRNGSMVVIQETPDGEAVAAVDQNGDPLIVVDPENPGHVVISSQDWH